ncbi:hypothetical protein ACFXTO_006516 [Malus domestica]
MLLEKAREEIYRVIGNKRLVGEPDVPNLPYLQAIIKETFRLHPPASLVTRKTVQKRDPKIWDCPLDFWPERFLQQGTDNQVNSVDVRGQHFQLLPFGSGRRVCPGVNLTNEMLPGVLAAMIQCFDWQVVGSSALRRKTLSTRTIHHFCYPLSFCRVQCFEGEDLIHPYNPPLPLPLMFFTIIL